MKQFLTHRFSNVIRIITACFAFLVTLTTVAAHIVFTQSALAAGTVIFVDKDAAGAATGVDWANAYPTLQDALQNATSDDELWITAGIYYPDAGGTMTDDDPTATFALPDGVSLYGGFDGSETVRTDADWLTNLTILSGDIEQNDNVSALGLVEDVANTAGNNTTTPIVTLAGINHLQGIYITAGKGRGVAADNATVSLTNVQFWGNEGASGGGMYSNATMLTLNNVGFYANRSSSTGGGLRTNGLGTVVIDRVWFKGNEAVGDGGGFYNRTAQVDLTNGVFAGNKGGLGAAFYNRNAQATLTNSTISGNYATVEKNGAAIHNRGNTALITLQNSIVWNNAVAISGSDGAMGFGTALGGPNAIVSTYSLIQEDRHSGFGNLDSTDSDNIPYFYIPIFPLDAPTLSGDLRLPANAPTVNAGSNGLTNAPIDLLGAPRVQNGTVNMGAFESAETQSTSCNHLYVNKKASGNNDGSTWADAYRLLQDAIAHASTFDRCELWIAAETYYANEGLNQTDDDPAATFTLTNGTVLVGGFAGDEVTKSERNWETNLTILSGDVDQDDAIDGNSSRLISINRAMHVIVDGVTLSSSSFRAIDAVESNLYMRNSQLTDVRGQGVYSIFGSTVLDNISATENVGVAVESVVANLVVVDSFFGRNSNHSISSDGGHYTSLNRVDFIGNSSSCRSHLYAKAIGRKLYVQNVNFLRNEGGQNCSAAVGAFELQYAGVDMQQTRFTANKLTGFYAHSGNGDDLSLVDVSFIDNVSEHDGGGASLLLIYFDDVSLRKVLFAGNRSEQKGGGLYLSEPSNLQLSNSAFNRNLAEDRGGAMYLTDSDADADATLTNVTIANNRVYHQFAKRGAAIQLNGSADLTLQNSIVWNNRSDEYTRDGNDFDDSSADNAINGGTWQATYSLIQKNDPAGEGNFNGGLVNPLFASVYDLRLQPASPLRNAGDNDAVLLDAAGNATVISAETHDLINAPRIQDSSIDLGAYEGTGDACVGNIIYVDQAATGDQTGLSWEHAFASLSVALNEFNVTTTCEIWVTEGEYTPLGSDTFLLPNGVNLYGGFDGTETARSERDWTAHHTILSGDLDQNDTKTNGIVTDIDNIVGTNAAVVVQATSGLTLPTRLDGVTITAGGTGIDNADNEWLIVENVTVRGNRLHGMVNRNAAPHVANVAFLDNGRDADGGGMLNNHASPTVINTLFARNGATRGAAIYSGGQGRPNLINLTIADNIASDLGGALYLADGSVGTLRNSLLWGNSNNVAVQNTASNYLVISHSLLQGELPAGIGNLDGADVGNVPVFVSAENYQLLTPSRAINAGSNTYLGYGSGNSATDLANTPRIANLITDIGAYETPFTNCAYDTPTYVDRNATGRGDGSSWQHAYRNLQNALQIGTAHCEIWVAQGTYYSDNGGYDPHPGKRTFTFTIPTGVHIFGGFAGTETTRAERNWATNRTILSGDRDQDIEEESFSVVTFDGAQQAQLDGVTVTGGRADSVGQDDSRAFGGGIVLRNSEVITLSHLVVTNNRAAYGGGIASVNGSKNISLINSEISHNAAVNVNFELSGAYWGDDYWQVSRYGEIYAGGVLNEAGSMTLLNNTVAYNTASQVVYDYWWHDNCFDGVLYGLTDNHGRYCSCNEEYGDPIGGYFESDCDQNVVLVIQGETGGIRGSVANQNGIVWDNTQADGRSTTAESPFMSPTNLQLRPTSSFVDAGDNAQYNAIFGSITTDLAHNNRIENGTIDRGAYECNGCSPTAVTLSFFTATLADASEVVLAWETASEIDMAGFHVYRASGDQFGETRITANLIAATALQGQGAYYELGDTVASAGVYVYRLVAFNADGSTEDLGARQIDVGVPTVLGLISAETHTPFPLLSIIAILLILALTINQVRKTNLDPWDHRG